uniref:Uncharacterized protein MANES_08G154300 n=1 Tax=Rhizophora mucronata TaxID=61149 RepID=A0A2P2LTF0_RHIMU
MNKPRPIFAPLQPNMLERLVRIIHQYIILILRPSYSRDVKWHLCFHRGRPFLISHLHTGLLHAGRRLHSRNSIPQNDKSLRLFLLPIHQLKPTLGIRTRTGTRARSQTRLELIDRGIKTLEYIVVDVDEPIVGGGIINVGVEISREPETFLENSAV